MQNGIPIDRTPVTFTTKLWKSGNKGIIIPIPKELRTKVEKWRQEPIYVLILPETETQRQQITIKTTT